MASGKKAKKAKKNGDGAAGEASALLPKEGKKVENSLSGEYVDYASSTRTMWLCLACIVLYLCLAVLAFSFVFERWTVIDSLYYGVVTFTTIGYGDLSPTTIPGKLFAIAYVIFGIAIVGVALGIVGEKVVESQEKALQKLKDGARNRLMAMMRRKKKEEEGGAVDTVDEEIEERQKTLCGELMGLLIADGPLLIVIILLAFGMGHYEGWEWIDSLYYCIITTTTVGYGDLSPQSEGARLFAVFYLPISVVLLAKILGGIATVYMDRQSAKAQKEFLHREVTLKDLNIMDIDKDGHVTLTEFLSFMLVAMQKIDKESIDELKALFNALDADKGGTLQKNDLVLLAQQK